MTWDIFALLFTMIATPVLASVTAMNDALANLVAPVLRTALIAFVAGSLLYKLFKPGVEPFGELFTLLIAGGIAIYMVSSSADYGTWTRDVILNGMAQGIPNALAGGSGARAIDGSAFGEIWGKAWVTGVAVYRNLPWSPSGLGLSFVVVLYWGVAVACTALSFAVWLRAFVFLALLVGIGPLFGGLWLFPWTRGWFFGWLNTMMASLVLMILSVALMTLLMAAITQLLGQLASSVGSNGNEFTQLGMLFGGMVLFGVCGWLNYQLPAAAGAITHGFAGYAGAGARRAIGIGQEIWRGLSGASASSGAPGPVGPAGQPGVTPARALAPPGPSLSNP